MNFISVENKIGWKAYHIVDWSSSKQRRISHSSYGAEILSCADADDKGFYLKEIMSLISISDRFSNVLNIDSRGFYDNITTLHYVGEYRLRQTEQSLRESFESGELYVIRWVPSQMNLADGLTKRFPEAQRLLNQVCKTSTMFVPAH